MDVFFKKNIDGFEMVIWINLSKTMMGIEALNITGFIVINITGFSVKTNSD